jgi:type I restriction enzyme S subunit
MSKWAKYKLNQLSKIFVSNVDKKINPNEIPVNLCNYMNVYSSRYIDSKQNYSIGSVSNQELIRFTLKNNDVIITKDSETPDDIAVPSLVIGDIDELVCGYHLAIVRPFPNMLDGCFLMNLLQIKQINRQFSNKANGSTRFGLTIDTMENAIIPKPPLPEQRIIASILNTIDKAIEATERVIAKRRSVKEGLMHDLFRYGLDEKGNLRSKATHRFKDSPLGRIPEEWEVVVIPQILVKKDRAIKIGPFGSQLKREYFIENGYKVYGQENAFNKDFSIGDRYINKKRFLQLKSCGLFPGDFIISMMGTIGKCAVVPDGIDKGIMDSHLIRLQIDDRNYLSSLLLQLLENYFPLKQQIINLSVGGIMQGLSSKIVKSLCIPKPPVPEQSRIAVILTAADEAIEKEEAYRDKLLAQKRGLMEDLLTGKVPVDALIGVKDNG